MITYHVVSSNGEIGQTGECRNEDFEKQAQPGETVMEGAVDGSLYYYNSGVLVARPTTNIAVDKTIATVEELITFTNIPVNTTVNVAGEQIEINDGVFEFTTTEAGRYVFFFKSFPYQDFFISVTVND